MTTDVVDPLGPSWDLGDVLRERVQPKTTVALYLNEDASYLKHQLKEAHAKALPENVGMIDQKLDEVDALLENSKYTVHLTAVPSRMREDISSKSLAKFPIKADLLGRDDHANSIQRMNYENSLVWLAQIVDVVNPEGASKRDWNQEQMDAFIAALPTKATQTVDEAIRSLTKAAEEFTASSASPDFWSPA